MSEQYVSLDPKEQDRYLSSQKRNLVSLRNSASAGEPFASQAGAPFGVASGLMAYHLISGKSFSLFPFAVSKAPKYGIILAAAFLGFHFGRCGATSVFKDTNNQITSQSTSQYLSGTGPLDPLTQE